MDMSYDHTNFGLWGPIFAFLTLFAENIKKSIVKKDKFEKLFKGLC
jgi:hypothetical protein